MEVGGAAVEGVSVGVVEGVREVAGTEGVGGTVEGEVEDMVGGTIDVASCNVGSGGGVDPRGGGRSRRLQQDSWNQSWEVSLAIFSVRSASQLTSHARHWIMASLSVAASYVR